MAQVEFDASAISYEELLSWFWRIHDPTSVDRQGEDEGPEYRSVIFAHTEAHLHAAQAAKDALQGSTVRPIVTSVEAAGVFYPASEKHQDYYRRNAENAHCQGVIAPHLEAVGLER